MIKDIASDNIVNETEPFYIIKSPPSIDAKTNRPYRSERNFKLVNFCYFYPILDEFKSYDISDNEKLIYSRKHFLSFPAYAYEGCSIKERNYKIAIYKID